MQFNRSDMVKHTDQEAQPDVSERPIQPPSQLEPLPPQRDLPQEITEQDMDRSGKTSGDPYSSSQAIAQDQARAD